MSEGKEAVSKEFQKEWNIVETDYADWVSPEGSSDEYLNEYHVLETIGAGSFGKVKLAVREVGEPPYRFFALKIMSKRKLRKIREAIHACSGYGYHDDDSPPPMRYLTGLEKVQREIEVLRHLYHRNIAILFEVIDDADDDAIILVTEFMLRGPAMKYEENECQFYHRPGAHLPEKELAEMMSSLVPEPAAASGAAIVATVRAKNEEDDDNNYSGDDDDLLKLPPPSGTLTKGGQNPYSEAATTSVRASTNLVVPPWRRGGMQEDQAASLFLDLVRGLQYLHSQGICHRDIKPENVLIYENGTLRIADFGCAEKFDRDTNPKGLVSNTAGTPAFWAPECIAPGHPDLDAHGDVGLDFDDMDGPAPMAYSSSALQAKPSEEKLLFGSVPGHGISRHPLPVTGRSHKEEEKEEEKEKEEGGDPDQKGFSASDQRSGSVGTNPSQSRSVLDSDADTDTTVTDADSRTDAKSADTSTKSPQLRLRFGGSEEKSAYPAYGDEIDEKSATTVGRDHVHFADELPPPTATSSGLSFGSRAKAAPTTTAAPMEKSTSDAAGKDSDLSNLAAALQASVLDEDDLPPTIPSGGGLPVPVSFGSLGKIPSRQNSTGLGDKGQHESTTSAISPAMNGSYLQCQVPTGPNLFSAYTADVWAAGVTLFCFLFGRVPFEAENPKELFELVLACQPNYELDAEGRKEDNSQGEPPSKGSISQDALTILQGILERDPAVRWDLHHIERAVVEWKDRVSWVSSQHSSA